MGTPETLRTPVCPSAAASRCSVCSFWAFFLRDLNSCASEGMHSSRASSMRTVFFTVAKVVKKILSKIVTS